MTAAKGKESPAAATTGPSTKLLDADYIANANYAIPTEEVKAAVSIEEYLASRGIRPAREGRIELSFHCPLGTHEDKTPSFFVNRAKQVWHCFGCEQGGTLST